MSHLYELHFLLPMKKIGLMDSKVARALHQAVQVGWATPDDLIRHNTFVRVWDEKSYSFARFLVKKRVFGMISPKHFTWIRVDDRSEHEFEAENVRRDLGAWEEIPFKFVKITVKPIKGKAKTPVKKVR